MRTRILIVDDHGVLRAGLRALISAEPDLEVVGEAADGMAALRLAAALHPDVALMDINLPQMDGLEVTQRLLAAQPDVRVLIFSMHEDKALLQEALRVGAAGYVVKRAVESELVNAIRAAMRGELYIHPAMTRALLAATGAPGAAPPGDAGADADAGALLTPREVEVLKLIALGHTNREIADQLMISPRTVESHRANLIGKLDLHSRVELVRYAAAHGWLDRQGP
jgi:two-component system response regulator NreC